MAAFSLSASLATATFALARAHLLSGREGTAAHQVEASAALLRQRIAAGDDPLTKVAAMATPADSTLVVISGSSWATSPAGVSDNIVSQALRARVLAGKSGRTHYSVAGSPPLVAAGEPLPGGNRAVFVVTQINGLDQALHTFAITLVGVAGLTTAAGAALGLGLGRLILRPLGDAAGAAKAIAEGNLDIRLVETADPDLGELATSFNSMVDALRDRIDRDSRFASNVSHELRSPLTALGTAAQVLAGHRARLADPDRQAVDLLVNQLARFERLVEDLLEISRADAGVIDLALEEVEVGELVAHAMANAGRPAPLHLIPGAGERHAVVDKRRIEQVLTNLLDNARAHGGGATGVTVSATGGKIRIAVEDDGPGVPDLDRTWVFERFARGARARNGDIPGTGLGLSLVAEHVRLHDGSVWVEPSPAGGARFVVELPATG